MHVEDIDEAGSDIIFSANDETVAEMDQLTDMVDTLTDELLEIANNL